MDDLVANKHKSMQFKQLAQSMINDPPRLSEHVGKLIPLVETVANVNYYLHSLLSTNTLLEDPDAVSLVDTMVKLRDELLYGTLCEYYSSFLGIVSMDQEHPSTAAMQLYLTVAYIELVLDSIYTKTGGIMPSSSSSIKVSAKELQGISSMGLVSSTVPVYMYSARQLIQSIKTLSLLWHQLEPSVHLLKYITGLIHRGCILITKPGKQKMHDLPAMRKLLNGLDEDAIWGGNWDLLRRLSGGLMRMLVVARFRILTTDDRVEAAQWYMHTNECSVDKMKENKESIKKSLYAEAGKLAAMDKFRGELQDMFRVSGMWFGDLDIFIEKCNMKPAKPRSVIFNAKQPDIQFTWNYLAQTVSIADVCKLDEESPFFQQCFTFVHQFYAQNIKMYCAGVILRQSNVNFIGDYCVSEQEFVGNKHLVLSKSLEAPLLIQNFGKIHVLYKRVLYICTSTEHAILVWGLIVRKLENNLLDGVIVTNPLSRLLNEAATFTAGDVWRDSDIIQGEID